METEHLVLLDLIDNMCIENDVTLQPLRVAEDIMNKDVKTLTLDHTVSACIKLMKALNIRHIPIIDAPGEENEKPYYVGVVSQRDVVLKETRQGCHQASGKRLEHLLVEVVADGDELPQVVVDPTVGERIGAHLPDLAEVVPAPELVRGFDHLLC